MLRPVCGSPFSPQGVVNRRWLVGLASADCPPRPGEGGLWQGYFYFHGFGSTALFALIPVMSLVVPGTVRDRAGNKVHPDGFGGTAIANVVTSITDSSIGWSQNRLQERLTSTGHRAKSWEQVETCWITRGPSDFRCCSLLMPWK